MFQFGKNPLPERFHDCNMISVTVLEVADSAIVRAANQDGTADDSITYAIVLGGDRIQNLIYQLAMASFVIMQISPAVLMATKNEFVMAEGQRYAEGYASGELKPR